MKLYKSCDSLSIYKMDRIAQTGDLRHLIIGYDHENDDLDLPMEKQAELMLCMEKIRFEFIVQSGSKDLELQIKSKISIKELELNIQAAEEVVNIFTKFDILEILVVLNKLNGFHYDAEGDLEEQIKTVKSKIGSLKTKLKIKTKQFNNKYKDKEAKSNIFEEAITMSNILELGYAINVETTSCTKWNAFKSLCVKRQQHG